jgi:hypothetical protein
MPLSSEDREEIKIHRLTLAFPQPFERDFQASYTLASMFQVRLALVLGIFLYSVFGFLDAWIIPEAKLKLWFIRYVCILPCSIFLFFTTYAGFFKRFMQPLLASITTVGGIGIVAMTVIASPGAGHAYYAGLSGWLREFPVAAMPSRVPEGGWRRESIRWNPRKNGYGFP